MKTRRVVSASLVAVAASALAITAAAQSTAKYKRTGARVEVKVKQTELTRGLKEKTGTKSEFVPEITADQFMNIQGQVKLIRAQQIAEYRRLIEEWRGFLPTGSSALMLV